MLISGLKVLSVPLLVIFLWDFHLIISSLELIGTTDILILREKALDHLVL